MIIKSGYQDSNLGPPAPKAGALTGLRYTPKYIKAVRAGFEPAVQCYPYAGLANQWFQPLTHLTFLNIEMVAMVLYPLDYEFTI